MSNKWRRIWIYVCTFRLLPVEEAQVKSMLSSVAKGLPSFLCGISTFFDIFLTFFNIFFLTFTNCVLGQKRGKFLRKFFLVCLGKVKPELRKGYATVALSLNNMLMSERYGRTFWVTRCQQKELVVSEVVRKRMRKWRSFRNIEL